MAASLVDAINPKLHSTGNKINRKQDAGAPKIVLTNDRSTKLDREFTFTVTAVEARHAVYVNPLPVQERATIF